MFALSVDRSHSHRRNHCIILAGAAALSMALVGVPAHADSCLPFLKFNSSEVAFLTLVTLNKKGVASYATKGATHVAAGRTPAGGIRSEAWTISSAPQTFSDRGMPAQPFISSNADKVGVSVGVAASPQVTVTLESWGNAKAVFTASCSAGGVMHGSTPDVDYLLFLNASIVR
jgi:hypothetical protein